MGHRLLFLLLFCMVRFLPLSGLELKRVILSTNNHPMYIQFWPIVAPLWKAIGLQPTLALIADENCRIDETLGDVYRLGTPRRSGDAAG